MTEDVFKLGLASLVNAFPNSSERITRESRDIYWELLRDIPNDLFERGIKKCMAECRFFPTVNDIGERALSDYTTISHRNNHVYIEPTKITWQEGLERSKRQETQRQIVPPEPPLQNRPQIASKKMREESFRLIDRLDLPGERPNKLDKPGLYLQMLEMEKKYPGIGWAEFGEKLMPRG